MSPKNLIILIVVTVALGVGAVVISKSKDAAVAATGETEELFPGLLGKINDAARIEVETADGGYVIAKEGETWGLASKGGYPVDFERVKKALVTLAELKVIESKTKDPARFEQLELRDPDAEGSKGRLVRIEDAGGNQLAALILGKNRPTQSGLATLYARKAGEDQCWLVEGRIDLDPDGTAWLDKQIMKVEKDRTRTIRVTHADGEVVTVTKKAPGDTTLEVLDVPEGRELRYPTVANNMTSAIEWCNMEDVVPEGEVELPEAPTSTAVFTTFDGMSVEVETFDVDDKTYARYSASFDEGDVYVPPTLEETGPTEEGESTVIEKPDIKPADEVRAEVEALNERTSGWVYVIPQYNKSTYQKRMQDMLKELEPEPEPEAPAAPEEGDATSDLPVLDDVTSDGTDG